MSKEAKASLEKARQLVHLMEKVNFSSSHLREVLLHKTAGNALISVSCERAASENICRPDPVFRPAGFTPPPEPDAASQRRAEMSLALLDSAEHSLSEEL